MFILGCLVTIIVFLITTLFFADSAFFSSPPSYLATIQAIGSIAIAGSAIVAFSLYQRTIHRHLEEDEFKASERFLDESIMLIERAYETFTGNAVEMELPRNSRLLWLTTARMIVRFEKMKKNITVPAHEDIVGEHVEFWRYQFYAILDAYKGDLTFEYLQVGNNMYDGIEIDRRSIAVIFDFAKWNGPDVLADIDDQLLFANRIVQPDQSGVIRFLQQYRDGAYWDEILEIQERDYPNSW